MGKGNEYTEYVPVAIVERVKSIALPFVAWIGRVRWMRRVRDCKACRALRKVFCRIPVSGCFETRFGHVSVTYCSDCFDLIGRQLFWHGLGSFEPETLEVVRSHIGPHTLFVDVGANTGVYSLFALSCGAARVLALEPEPRIYGRLVDNLRRSDYTNWRATAAAASNYTGRGQLHVPNVTAYPTSASLHRNGFRDMPGRLIEIDCKRVDDVLEEVGVDALAFAAVVVKIDVEGFEDRVLEGMSALMQHPAILVIFEAHRDGPVERLEALFGEQGFEIMHIGTAGLTICAPFRVSREQERCWNYLARRPIALPQKRNNGLH